MNDYWSSCFCGNLLVGSDRSGSRMIRDRRRIGSGGSNGSHWSVVVVIGIVRLGSLDHLRKERRTPTASPNDGCLLDGLLVGHPRRRNVDSSGLGDIGGGGGPLESGGRSVQLRVETEVGAEGLVGLLHVSFEGIESSKVEFV